MGETDCLARKFFGKKQIFADVFNTLCFNGKHFIDSSKLQEMSPVLISRNRKGQSVELSRDLLMRMTEMTYGDTRMVLLGLEHQSYVNYEMPLRCMYYDALTYLRECDEKKSERTVVAANPLQADYLGPGEFLPPVLTAVVYIGETPWNGPRRLSDLLTPIPKGLKTFFNDYQMPLLTPEDITEERLSSFQSEVGEALYYARLSSNREKLHEYVHRTQLELTVDTVEFLNASLNIHINTNNTQKEGKINMCKAWDEQYAEGLEKGLERGLEKGREEGLEKGREEGLEKGREEGLEKGREEGLEKGREEGLEKGREEERRKNITGLIAALRPTNSDEQICTILATSFGISITQARSCLEKQK